MFHHPPRRWIADFFGEGEKRGKMKNTTPKSIDEYIKRYPSDVQAILRKIRATIHTAAPDAKEAISYQIPTFKLEGNLVHFAAFPDHMSFFPTSSGVEKFKRELAAYEITKGTIRFPIEKPIPYGLITKITKFRVKENIDRAKKKR
jgi:uncharacterized protein YdhG (YjbR/CyaY superfamily)